MASEAGVHSGSDVELAVLQSLLANLDPREVFSLCACLG